MMYEWLKVVHILAVISWMAGLLYLPRLFVYHVDATLGSDQDETFKVMERRLIKAIMRPAAVVTLISGVALVGVAGYSMASLWLQVKLLAVVGMVLVHGKLEAHVAQFGRGLRLQSSRYFRIFNEVPTVLMIIIVVMVVVQPFG
jgi:protoporphyrinogen IX oxidase